MVKNVVDWIDDRTGVVSAVQNFLDEDIPASAGWHQVFGSVALFVLLTQFLTGALLALNYAAQPDAAYQSLQYIINEIPGGHLVRGLHHWGATLMVVVVVLHMVQVALWGAYKKPREATWMVGVVLLLLTLGFGLTGYLLPWDNKAYWATVVTVQISSLAPFAGDLVMRLLGSPDGTVGVGTFQRFYALHTMILPAITIGLAVFHVALVRRHGVAPAPGDESKPKKPFYPDQVYKDTVAVFVAFTALFLAAVLIEPPLEALADPTDTTYIPRPEWYFLFLFQMLKFFKGSLEVIGAVILPTLAIIALILVPFLDRGRLRKVTNRVTAIGIVAAAAIGWSALTVAAIVTTPERGPERLGQVVGMHWSDLTPSELAGYAYFQDFECGQCHNLVGGEPKPGPTLALLRGRKPQAWVEPHVKSPGSGVRNDVSRQQVLALASFSSQVTPEKAGAAELASEQILQGVEVYRENNCEMCHQINHEGQTVGPPLERLATTRDAQWLEQHFRDPQSLVEGSTMPPYDLPQPEMDALVAYMLGL